MKSIKQWPIFHRLVLWANRHFPVLVCKLRFRMYFGRKMNLKQPQDINEKISWLELYSDTSLWSKCTDKYAVREYVKECGLESILVKLYGKWDNANDIDWNTLPQQFVLKTNNGCGTILLVSDKSKLDYNSVSVRFNNMLHQVDEIATTEFHYQSIPPCIIAEELLVPDEKELEWSTSIVDYKLWCFSGRVDSVFTISNRDENKVDVALFDRDWNYRPEASVFDEHHREQKILIPRPECLEEMIAVAEKLAKPFPCVRVDLYVVKGKIYFGELTFTSLGGTMYYFSDAELLRMGQKIDLSGIKKIKK